VTKQERVHCCCSVLMHACRLSAAFLRSHFLRKLSPFLTELPFTLATGSGNELLAPSLALHSLLRRTCG